MATAAGRPDTAVNLRLPASSSRRCAPRLFRSTAATRRQTLKNSAVRHADDGRKFTELYNVQHLQSAQLERVKPRLHSPSRAFTPCCAAEDRPGSDDAPATKLRESLWKQPPRSFTTERPYRDLRLHHHDEMPPLHLQSLAQVLEYFEPISSAHRHAFEQTAGSLIRTSS